MKEAGFELRKWATNNPELSAMITLYNVCSVHRGVFSTLGGYHEYIGGYHEYIGGIS